MSRSPLLYATTNIGKLAEVTRIGADLGIPFEGLANLTPKAPVIVEDGWSYADNAAKKARSYARWFERGCFADDSGIEISDLGGYPGVYTARVGVAGVLAKLGKAASFEARFVCCVAYAEPSGRCVAVTRELEGRFISDRQVRSDGGALEFSPYFVPVGEQLPLNELLRAGYNDSHRARALRDLLSAL